LRVERRRGKVEPLNLEALNPELPGRWWEDENE